MKKILLLVILSFFIFTNTMNASYVLPYPSSMPGGISYRIHLVWEKLIQYWYFGDFGNYEYNLKESDKYLVESKTLFEYQQYLLGVTALQKSNDYFAKILPSLQKARQHGKNIQEKRIELHEASQKHIEVLHKMEGETPESFNWSPEKLPASNLRIHALIDTSITQREKDL